MSTWTMEGQWKSSYLCGAVFLILEVMSGAPQMTTQLPPHRYYFVNLAMTWAEAQSYCKAAHTDLATIENKEDFAQLIDAAVGYTGNVWIGLESTDTQMWRSSLYDPDFYGEGEAGFAKWGTNEPNSNNPHHTCVRMVDNGYFYDDICSAKYHFVCSIRDKDHPSKQDFVRVAMYKTWRDAQIYCREYYTELAIVRNQTEIQEILTLIPVSYWIWIGLYKDSWKWSDGSDSTFRSWSGDYIYQTDSGYDCSVSDLGNSGYWNDVTCDAKLPFFCYSDKLSSLMEVKMKIQTDADMTDPFIQQQVLKQLEAKMKLPNVKLHWRSVKPFFQEEEKKCEEMEEKHGG